jgi:hypothetical protein
MAAMEHTNSGDAVHFSSPRPHGEQSYNPFANAVWVKNMIASNAIVPPHGESASVRRTDFAVGLCVICFIVAGLGAFAASAFIKW